MTTRLHRSNETWPAWRKALWAVVPIVLVIPAIAMMFTNEVRWSAGDFAVAAALLVATAMLADVIVRGTRSLRTTAILLGVLLAGALFVWIELAVGLVGSPFAGS